MKQMIRLIALILCAALMISLAGCAGNTAPAETEPSAATEPTTAPTTAPTEPPAPPAEDVYAQARAGLDSLTDVTMEMLVTTYTTVAGDKFSQQATQFLTYKAIGSEEAVIVLEEDILFSVHQDEGVEEVEDEEEPEPVHIREIWSQGTVYTEYDKTYRYSGPVDAETLTARYMPVVLLNAELYGSISSEISDNGTAITFAEPTAAETWAIPEEAELVEASGSALVSPEGILTEMKYTVTYQHGPAQITLEVQSKPLDTPRNVAAPSDPTAYTPLSYVDGLRMTMLAPAMLMQADSVSVSDLESTFTQAAGVMYNVGTSVELHGRSKDTIAKIESDVFFMDYSSMSSEELSQEETFVDGKLTTVVNDGLPTTDSSVSWEDIREFAAERMVAGFVGTDYWKDITATDLGSLLLLEYEFNDNFGNSNQNEVCAMLWNDPSFLYNLASEYKNVEVNGYLSIDKFTGIPVAAGYYYEGLHTIDGVDYPLTVQFDQSIEAPALGAYKAITEKQPPEEEPETKPTPLFYHVTGEEGQEMWLLGTIHVGDSRTAFLPEEIYNAFAASDALALECDTEAFDEELEKDDALSEKVSDLYVFSANGDTFESLMEEEEYDRAVQLLKAVGGYNMNMPYLIPSAWSDSIDLFSLRQGYQLHRDMGVERRLYAWAEELEKEIIEVESNMFQLEMLTGFSNDLQLLLLEESMEYMGPEYYEGVLDLYEKWCAGDEAVLREELSDEDDTSEFTEEELAEYNANKPLYDEYDKAVSIDRNAGMLKKAIEYLESGEVIFYAVGLAHLLNDTNGLVDTLREAGYTVELVTYAS